MLMDPFVMTLCVGISVACLVGIAMFIITKGRDK